MAPAADVDMCSNCECVDRLCDHCGCCDECCLCKDLDDDDDIEALELEREHIVPAPPSREALEDAANCLDRAGGWGTRLEVVAWLRLVAARGEK